MYERTYVDQKLNMQQVLKTKLQPPQVEQYSIKIWDTSKIEAIG